MALRFDIPKTTIHLTVQDDPNLELGDHYHLESGTVLSLVRDTQSQPAKKLNINLTEHELKLAQAIFDAKIAKSGAPGSS